MLGPQLDSNGFCLIESIFEHSECEAILRQLEVAMNQDEDQFNVRQSRGTVFAARNIVELCPAVLTFWRKDRLVELLVALLGPETGLVRVLYFDKPSDRSWSLPFHKDMTIAVKDNSLPTQTFSKPTKKAGVDHVEASELVLQNMLTLRIHLDQVTDDNGPLQVIPGSHLSGKQSDASTTTPEKILCNAGDVLAMRPLISHGSAHSQAGTNLHRRILHLEFCGQKDLPDGYRWHFFDRVNQSSS